MTRSNKVAGLHVCPVNSLGVLERPTMPDSLLYDPWLIACVRQFTWHLRQAHDLDCKSPVARNWIYPGGDRLRLFLDSKNQPYTIRYNSRLYRRWTGDVNFNDSPDLPRLVI